VLFVLATAHTVYPTTYAFSTMEGLGWSSGDVGFSLGAFAIASMAVQGGLIRVIIPKIGLFWAGFIGITSAAIAYTMMGSADAGWIIYAAGPLAALAGLYGPALTNMMAMTGMFGLFADTANRADRQMQAFPDNIIGTYRYFTGRLSKHPENGSI